MKIETTELRGRTHTASYSSPRMAPKVDKEWQSHVEAMEKRVMDSINKLDKRMVENTQELYGKVTENMVASNKKLMEEIKNLVVTELKEVKKDIGDIRIEISKAGNKVQEMEEKMQKVEKQVKDLKEVNKNLELKYEIKLKDLQLRMRHLEEEKDKEVREKVLDILASFGKDNRGGGQGSRYIE